MAMIEINRNPSRRELRVFAAILLAFFGLVGTLVLYGTGARTGAFALWGIGAALSAAGLWYPAFMREVYVLWMVVFHPVGWIVSNAMLGFIYYLVLTPIALLVRMLRRDPLDRRLERSRASYWIRYSLPDELERYFRQH